MEFRILGPLEVRDGDRVVALGGPRQHALLALLLLYVNQPVPTDRLIDELWEEPPPSAAKTVQVCASRLRKALGAGDRLVNRAGGYVLRVEAGERDVDRFEQLLRDGREAVAADPERATATLDEALALWRGPPLQDAGSGARARRERIRLEELCLAALEERIEADLALGRGAQLVPELEALVAEHPVRERLRGQLMLALYRSGRQAEALDAYGEGRRRLVEELGLEPGPALRALQQAILDQRPDLDVTPVATPASRLPLPPTPTVGREHELEQLRALLAEPATRLVTVVGPAGVGKTRLAVEAGRPAGDAVFVSLASLASADLVASAIVRALGLPAIPEASPEALLRHALTTRELLLILDNFEHVLGAAPLVADLLAAAPALTVLATSRSPLRLRAERTFRLGPLAEPCAVELFRVLASAHDFALASDADDLGRLCRRLDGLPLAIELAAARATLLSPGDLLRRLEDSLDVLGSGPRDAPDRQRSLHATLDWSYQLLQPAERTAFAGLSVFAGGADLAAAQVVVAAPIEILEGLSDKQLVVAHRNGQLRLAMLDTVRGFAREQLAVHPDADVVSRRHAEHFLAVAERVASALRATDDLRVAEHLEPDLDNVRAALAWALAAPEPELALRLAVALDGYLRLCEPGEGERWVAAALALGGKGRARGWALQRRGFQLNRLSDFNGAQAATREALELFDAVGDARGRAETLVVAAYTHTLRRRLAEARATVEEAATWARRAGDSVALAHALSLLAAIAETLELARSAAEEGVAIFTRLGNHRQLLMLHILISFRALCDGDHPAAELAIDRGRRAAHAAGSPAQVGLADLEGNDGSLALARGQHRSAAVAFLEEIRLARLNPGGRPIFEGLLGLAAVTAATGHPEIAARLHGAADVRLADAEQLDDPLIRQLERVIARAGADRWPHARAAGADMSVDAAIELARSVIGGL